MECAIRAEQVRVADRETDSAGRDSVFSGTVRERIFEGDRVVYEVSCPDLDDSLVYAFEPDPLRHELFAPGDCVSVAWNSRDLMVFVD